MNEDTLLRVEGVDAFYGESHVLHDVSFEISGGEMVTLVGRNGAGKTTTLRSIMGLTPPRSGRILLKEQEIQSLRPYRIRQLGVSLVPEDRRIFHDLTVDENIRLAGSAGDGTRTGLDDVYQLFPRLDERRSQRTGTMSGGEQQMLAIARALVGPETELLLLDEPSEGLAPKIIDDVRDSILTLNDKGVTVLLVEQNADLALEIADRAYVLETGRIEYRGGTEELRANEDLMQEYLGVR